MKRLSLQLAFLVISLNGFSQGFVTFNNIGSPITSCVTGGPLGPGWTVDLVVEGRVLASTPIVGGGTFLGSEPVDLGTTDPVDVTIRAWPTEFGDYATAATTFGAELLEGVTFSAQGGNANASPPEVPRALGFPGAQTVCIPEPSSFSLVALTMILFGLKRRARRG